MSSEIREHPDESNGVNNGTPPLKRLKKDVDSGAEIG